MVIMFQDALKIQLNFLFTFFVQIAVKISRILADSIQFFILLIFNARNILKKLDIDLFSNF
jgi:hypothetical protein